MCSLGGAEKDWDLGIILILILIVQSIFSGSLTWAKLHYILCRECYQEQQEIVFENLVQGQKAGTTKKFVFIELSLYAQTSPYFINPINTKSSTRLNFSLLET